MQNEWPDYTLLVYPIAHVLFVNKVCNTALYRKNNSNPVADLKLLRKMKNLWLGFVPSLAFYAYQSNTLTFYEEDDGLMVAARKGKPPLDDEVASNGELLREALWDVTKAIGATCFINVQNIIVARMRNIEYRNNKNFRGVCKDLVVKDSYKMLFKGIVPFTLGYSFINSTIEDEEDLKDWPLGLAITSILAHPFMLLATRVQCNIFG